jgi:hypothetical protein
MGFDATTAVGAVEARIDGMRLTAEYSNNLKEHDWAIQFRLQLQEAQKPVAGDMQIAAPDTRFRDEDGNIVPQVYGGISAVNKDQGDSIAVTGTVRFEPQVGVGVPEAGGGLKFDLENGDASGRAAVRVFTPGLGNGGSGVIIKTDGETIDANAFPTNFVNKTESEIPDPVAPSFNGNNARLLK